MFAQGLKPAVSAFFVGPHQSRIAGNVGRQDGAQSSLPRLWDCHPILT
jgi:hypothetical protein